MGVGVRGGGKGAGGSHSHTLQSSSSFQTVLDLRVNGCPANDLRASDPEDVLTASQGGSLQGLPTSGVPSCDPYYKGILLFGVETRVPVFRKPRSCWARVVLPSVLCRGLGLGLGV